MRVVLVAAVLGLGFFASPGAAWERRGRGQMIDVGARGHVWIIGTEVAPRGGCRIYRWTGTGWAEAPGNGGARDVAVAPDGTPWVVNEEGRIYRLEGDGWREVPGGRLAWRIDIGADGSVWVIGREEAARGGNKIYRWTGAGWAEVDGGAHEVAVGPDGTPWVVNDVCEIYRRVDGGWVHVPGRALDIDIGADGSVWVISTEKAPLGGKQIFKRVGGDWVKVEGGGWRIGVDPAGNPWVCNAHPDQEVYQGRK